MTKNQIIESIYHNPLINNSLKGKPEDFQQEFWTIIAEKDESLIKELHNDGKLIHYCLRTIKNQFYSATSPYYYKYKKDQNLKQELIDNPEISQEDQLEYKIMDHIESSDESDKVRLETLQMIEDIEKFVDSSVHWADALMFKLYYLRNVDPFTGEIQNPMSYRQLEKYFRGNLDHLYIRNRVLEVKNKVIQHLNRRVS